MLLLFLFAVLSQSPQKLDDVPSFSGKAPSKKLDDEMEKPKRDGPADDDMLAQTVDGAYGYGMPESYMAFGFDYGMDYGMYLQEDEASLRKEKKKNDDRDHEMQESYMAFGFDYGMDYGIYMQEESSDDFDYDMPLKKKNKKDDDRIDSDDLKDLMDMLEDKEHPDYKSYSEKRPPMTSGRGRDAKGIPTYMTMKKGKHDKDAAYLQEHLDDQHRRHKSDSEGQLRRGGRDRFDEDTSGDRSGSSEDSKGIYSENEKAWMKYDDRKHSKDSSGSYESPSSEGNNDSDEHEKRDDEEARKETKAAPMKDSSTNGHRN